MFFVLVNRGLGISMALLRRNGHAGWDFGPWRRHLRLFILSNLFAFVVFTNHALTSLEPISARYGLFPLWISLDFNAGRMGFTP